MNTSNIRQMIVNATKHEKSTGLMAQAVRNLAQMTGARITEQNVQETVNFVKDYIQHVPAILETTASTARNAGVLNQVAPILEAAEQYFLQPLDLIPDNIGLIGLMDDAYLAHCLLQIISDQYRNETGTPLVGTDMTSANRLIRVLIGEPLASALDSAVMNILQGPTLQHMLQQFMALGAQFPVNVPDPIYGNTSIDEIVDARLGALGVV